MLITIFYLTTVLVSVKSVNNYLYNTSNNLQSKYCAKYITDYLIENKNKFEGKYYVVLMNENDLKIPLRFTFGKVVFNHDYEATGNDADLLKAEGYILFLEKTSLEEMLYFLSRKTCWNSRAVFIITNIKEENIAQVKNLLNKYKISDFVYCQPGKIFKKKKRNNAKHSTLRILAISDPPYIFRNDQGEFDGLEYKMLRTITEKLNFKFTLLKNEFHTWGLRQDNGVYSHMFGQLQNSNVDVILGICPINFTNSRDFDVCFPYMYEKISWVVPKAGHLPQWKKILNIFSTNLIISLAVTQLIATIIMCNMSKYVLKRELLIYKTFISTLLIIEGLFLSVSMFRQPKTIPIRTLFISLTFAVVLLATAYQSKLVSILTQPLHDKQISNTQELLQSNLKLGVNLNIRSAFNNKKHIQEYEMFQRSEICDLSLKCLNRTAFKHDFAVTKPQKSVDIALLKYYTQKDGSELIYVFKKPIIYIYVGTFFSKGHILYEEYNKYCKMLFESGLIDKWFEDLKWGIKIKLKLTEKSRNISLSIQHTSGFFYILLGGNGLCIITFFFEIIYYKYIIIKNKLCNTIM